MTHDRRHTIAMHGIWTVALLTCCVTAVAASSRVRRQGSAVQFRDSPSCSNPRREAGKCLGIRNCPELLEMLRTRRQEPGVADFLRASVCGYDGLDPRVCCPIRGRSPGMAGFEVITPRPSTGFELSSRAPVFTAPPFVTEATSENNRASHLPVPPYCGATNSSNGKVVGGQPAALGAWPWIAALGYKSNSNGRNGPEFKCGGTLITDRHVVTAGHCVHNQPGLLFARLGELDLASNNDGANPIDIPISNKKIHESYSPTQYTSDIAILTLQRSAPYTAAIHPICLPTSQELRTKNFVRYQPHIAGWGTTSFRGPTSNTLQQVQIPVVETAACKRAFQTFHNTVIDDRVICAGHAKSKHDACQGDSGGPLMLPADAPKDNSYYLIGVISFGFKCAEPGFPGVYTRVTAFVDWIDKNTK